MINVMLKNEHDSLSSNAENVLFNLPQLKQGRLSKIIQQIISV